MSATEYLTLFSNQGGTRVKVKFEDSGGSIREQSMRPHELQRLVCAASDRFVTAMTFDEWPFEILRYEIDPMENTLTIHAGPARTGSAS